LPVALKRARACHQVGQLRRFALRAHLAGQGVQLRLAAAAQAYGPDRLGQVQPVEHGIAHGEGGLGLQRIDQRAGGRGA
jgi:hypothetical protein